MKMSEAVCFYPLVGKLHAAYDEWPQSKISILLAHRGSDAGLHLKDHDRQRIQQCHCTACSHLEHAWLIEQPWPGAQHGSLSGNSTRSDLARQCDCPSHYHQYPWLVSQAMQQDWLPRLV